MGVIWSRSEGVLKEEVNLEECHKAKRAVVPFCRCIEVYDMEVCNSK